jgi:hypothetical protein
MVMVVGTVADVDNIFNFCSDNSNWCSSGRSIEMTPSLISQELVAAIPQDPAGRILFWKGFGEALKVIGSHTRIELEHMAKVELASAQKENGIYSDVRLPMFRN